jgi:hypothetical protein
MQCGVLSEICHFSKMEKIQLVPLSPGKVFEGEECCTTLVPPERR